MLDNGRRPDALVQLADDRVRGGACAIVCANEGGREEEGGLTFLHYMVVYPHVTCQLPNHLAARW